MIKLPGTFALLLVALCGCMGGPRPTAKYFLLSPGTPPSMADMRTDGTVSVTFVDVGAPFSSDGFVYRLSGDQWETDPYNQFLVSPADMMTGTLRNWLQDSQLFRNVAFSGEGGGQTYIVDCNLTDLYVDFRVPSDAKAIVTMEVQVFRRTQRGRELVLRKVFSQAAPIAERRPEAIVEAWNEGLRLNLSEFLSDLAGKVR